MRSRAPSASNTRKIPTRAGSSRCCRNSHAARRPPARADSRRPDRRLRHRAFRHHVCAASARRAHPRHRSEPCQPRLRQAHGAERCGFDNVEFAQADITKTAAIGRSFDFIDASGVLHHLADPWEGWRVLLSLLRPGGMMQVGLYSELARQNVVAARALIAERGYRPIPEDIRRCREEIMAADDGSLLNSVSTLERFLHHQRMPRPILSRRRNIR